jgi:hypothetical protein
MALDPTVLADLIITNIQSATGNTLPAASSVVWGAVAAAIITHLTTAGVVEVVSVSGVTTGSGVSGPGAGTIT